MIGVIIRWIVYGLAVSALLLWNLTSVIANESNSLSISTWPGAYEKSQQRAFFAPYTKFSGTKINVSTEGQDIDALKSWYYSGKSPFDVIDLDSYTAEKACEEGYLVSLEADNIAKGANDEPIEKDFIGNSLIDCAVPNVAWSGLMVVKPSAFKRKKPRRWADFFDLVRFPGKRSFKKSAAYSMEIALMADGVRPDEIYETLSTGPGRLRAFKKLNLIRDEIVWWQKGSDAIEILRRDDVVMGLAFNGRLFNAIIADGLDVNLIWQGQIYDLDYWAIPKHAKSRQEALNFIKFATSSKQLAEQSKWVAYGPMRYSSLALIGKHENVKLHMAPFIPTTKAHMRHALKFDEGWWKSPSGQLASSQFKSWMRGVLDLEDETLWRSDE